MKRSRDDEDEFKMVANTEEQEHESKFWLDPKMHGVRTNYIEYGRIITDSISSDTTVQTVIGELLAIWKNLNIDKTEICKFRAKGYLSIMSHGGTMTISNGPSDKKSIVIPLAKPINMTFIAPIGIKNCGKPENRENVGKFYSDKREHLSRNELAQIMIFDGSDSSAVFKKIFERISYDTPITDENIDEAINEVFAENPDLNRDYLTLSVKRRAEIYNHPLSFSSWHGNKVTEKRISYNTTNIFLDNPSVMLRIKFKHENPNIDTTTYPYITIKLFSQYLPNTTDPDTTEPKPDTAPATLSNLINISFFIINVINGMMMRMIEPVKGCISALDAQNIPMLDVFDASCSTTKDEISPEVALQMAQYADSLNLKGLVTTQDCGCESLESTQVTQPYDEETQITQEYEYMDSNILEEMLEKIRAPVIFPRKIVRLPGGGGIQVKKTIKKRQNKRRTKRKRIKITKQRSKRRNTKQRSKRRNTKQRSKRRNTKQRSKRHY